jgi:hypothetical protein
VFVDRGGKSGPTAREMPGGGALGRECAARIGGRGIGLAVALAMMDAPRPVLGFQGPGNK